MPLAANLHALKIFSIHQKWAGRSARPISFKFQIWWLSKRTLDMALENSANSEVQTGASIRRMLSFFSCCGSSQKAWVVEPGRYIPPSPIIRDNDEANEVGSTNPDPPEIKAPCCSKSEERDDDHQFYCPICMCFFEDILKTSCCSHHICEECHHALSQRGRKESGYTMILTF